MKQKDHGIKIILCLVLLFLAFLIVSAIFLFGTQWMGEHLIGAVAIQAPFTFLVHQILSNRYPCAYIGSNFCKTFFFYLLKVTRYRWLTRTKTIG